MKNRLFYLLTLLCLGWSLSAQTIYYVDGTNGNDNANDGKSWAKAFKTITKAISIEVPSSAVSSVQVWIKGGRYPQSVTLNPVRWVHLYGGFSGTESTYAERAKVSGGKPWEFVNTTYIEPDATLVSDLVVQTVNFDNNNLTLIDGITFQNSLKAGFKQRTGSRVQYCTFANNSDQGMSMYPGGNVGYCYFFNNKASTNGAGLSINFTTGNAALVEHCTFEGNNVNTASSQYGNAVHLQHSGVSTGTSSSVVIKNSIFYNNGNSGKNAQGGALNLATPYYTVANCLIYNNSGANTIRITGGNGADGLFCNNTIANNTGHGIYINSTDVAKKSFIYNTVIWGHPKASQSITSEQTGHVLKNCVYYSIYASPNASNCIPYSPVGDNSGVQFLNITSFRGASTDATQIKELRNAVSNWQLRPMSPLRNKGDKDLLPETFQTTDVIGNPRIINDKVDIGAFESNGQMTEEDNAVLTIVDYYKKNSYRKWGMASDVTEAVAKDKLLKGVLGKFEDMATNQSTDAFILKAWQRLWIIAESYRGKVLSTTDFPALRDRFWAAVSNYSTLEINNSNRWHSSCFLIPTAAANIYFSLFDDMDKTEKGESQYESYLDANKLIKRVGYQTWSQPSRGDYTDENPVQIERFRNHEWWVGGNALAFRALIPVAAMLRSVDMIANTAIVAQKGLDATSQNTFTDAFWTEGFTVDGAGWGHGKQNYIWGYPSDGAGAAVSMLVLLKNTPWAQTLSVSNKRSLMTYFRGGAWFYHKGYTPPCLDRHSMAYVGTTKQIPYRNTLENIKNNFLSSFSSEEQAEINKLYNETSTTDISMDSYPAGYYTGSRWFFNNDDLIKKNSNYYWFVNMSSSRCDGIESAHTMADRKNFYTVDGQTLLQRKGYEYQRALGASVLSALPGITARQCANSELSNIENWRGYTSKHNWAAGATRGEENAVGGFIFEKKDASGGGENPKVAYGVYAQKGYFMQGDYLVCLGSGVTNRYKADFSNKPIYTTLDQTVRTVKPIELASTESSSSIATTENKIQSVDASTWVFQYGGFGYKLLSPYSSSMILKAETRPTDWNSLNAENASIQGKTTEANMLQLSIDHGVAATDATYGYVVYGGVDVTKATELVAKPLPFDVISNTKELQAIRSTDNKTIQALFYTHTTPLTWNEGQGTLQVSAPCALQVEETSTSFFITLGEATMSKTLSQIEVLTSLPLGSGSEDAGNGLRKVVVPLPAGENACASITVEVSKSTSAIPTPEHSPSLISVTRQGEQIYITTECPSEVRINNMGGSTIFRKNINGTYGVVLPQGVYIISGSSDKGAQSIKVKQ